MRTRPAPPVRIVHVGLGAFSRAHTAWYTARAEDASEWGISAYAGRSSDLADALTAQDGVYTLVVRDEDGDHIEQIESIVRAHPGADVAQLVEEIAASTTAIVTLTITEAGYRTTMAGEIDRDDPLVAADLERLARLDAAPSLATLRPATALGRILLGLELRRRRDGRPVAIVSCDNLPDNGGHLRRGLSALASETSPTTARWIDENVSFVSTSIDRITPRVSADELRRLSDEYGDRVPVVTEPFHDWVIAGEFPAGRPKWESAGARFTDDLEPWEVRKLWLLNGAHTLLACLGPLRGHATVYEAISDPECREAVDAYWDEAARHLPAELGIPAYRAALVDRFSRRRIVHHLAQIALDTATKLRVRIVPVAKRERQAGRTATGCAAVFAAWIASQTDVVGRDGMRSAVAPISERLAADDGFLDQIERATERLRKEGITHDHRKG
ncbi:mannitol dehydrogenase family protein [Microbacterium awajiense]|uniref:mannitol dehydrogenase family protein n=1 Tax=Microbacterium awajiense TaxID=415214 RepID=UPI0031E44758